MNDLLPTHKCGLYLEHNACRDVYETAAQCIADDESRDPALYTWESDEHRQRAIDTNEVWTLQWYPERPSTFFAVAAPTLSELLAFAKSCGES
jgi:hypothetical protein